MNDDPLTVSVSQLRVHALLEKTLCPSSNHRYNCKCVTLHRQYGPRLFKCNRFGCPFFRNGFETVSARDRHILIHDRPYKCDRPNCDFSHMGFASQARLNVHLTSHQKQGRGPATRPADVEEIDEVELMLLDAVKADDLDLVRDFRADITMLGEKFLLQAVKWSSREISEMLLDVCNNDSAINDKLLESALFAGNLEAVRILTRWGASPTRILGLPGNTSKVIELGSVELIKFLYPYYNTDFMDLQFLIPFGEPEPSEELRCIECLSLFLDWPNKQRELERCFNKNASSYRSIPIAKFLLRHGVHVDCERFTNNTALLRIAGNKTKRAAEFMKFLLESGANPRGEPSKDTRPLANRPGPRNISKWFGISWEQLVEESARKYAASSKQIEDETP